ncbi:hypothetical protein GGS23DRAFT_14841 [Durotheca rogersii]|uniref:uncharacterized protein n=1 Tax=Durotheca rogersii TaxID=419775 RepID=UPI00221FA1DD|nr:uncharacterized protein GGS23DRAFT_14841 [Durotheca rogersii]KAI5868155.1 hypothetical protein GGS23DRAFT_14841 [Durotheca rogersii]
MFVRRACLRRAFATVTNRSLRPAHENTHPTPIPLPAGAAATPSPQRRYASVVAAPVAASASEPHEEAKQRKVSRPWRPTKPDIYEDPDPLLIANHVKRTLEAGKFDEAAKFTRQASLRSKVVVSWNHLIDYHIRQDRVHASLKLFNEMKKRNQMPNAQTYTIIFRGLAASSHTELAVSEASKIYFNMLGSNYIEPNTIHMNAVLQVCSNAGDLETLFRISETANETARAANCWTYNILLHALRRRASRKLPERAGPEFAAIPIEQDVEQVIKTAKRIWETVILEWRAGNILVDEPLVCEMGRILLLGDYFEALTVESLLEQTMMIPSVGRAAMPVADIPGGSKSTNLHNIPYAQPGNNSLSLILEALERSRRTSRTKHYWGHFIHHHKVVPDADNWRQLFKALHRGCDSAGVISWLRAMPAEFVGLRTFRLPMNTCMRNNLNRLAFGHATEVLNIMVERLRDADAPTLRTYLIVAQANKRHFFLDAKGDREAALKAYGKQLYKAIDAVWKHYMLLARRCEDQRTGSALKMDVIALARQMISVCDRLVTDNMIPARMANKTIGRRRNSLTRVVVNHFENMREEYPKFRQGFDKQDEDQYEKKEEEDWYPEKNDRGYKDSAQGSERSRDEQGREAAKRR